ncbi:MerR family DNA-binding transcriptional regulator [Propionimicrobium sp. PCR01-08-3]|uniref:MerR family transcriptional regulator n=1 Tax=Propionimicrobium sp. PCR01-08-3 TaxID=3052086 RepID=UPI00255CCC3B|nr:MerR family DNA-binding transcriptional regulator [Propionimicrobium sp. PCR01-08-3]WIY83107.1 MerR family DNA-binding transcriptional regulator [Propionimicrobium sp. PCR01-08-3]
MQIGEVSRRSGVSVRMLRHYDRINLVRPSERTASGYREYSSEDLRRLFQAEALRTLGLTLAQVAEALDAPDFAVHQTLAQLVDRTRDQIAAEQQLLGRLLEIDSTAPQDWGDVLDVVSLLTGLRSASASERQESALRAGREPASLLPQLVDAYLAEDEAHASGALRWAIAQAPGDAIPLLAAHAADPDQATRSRAVSALSKLGGVAAASALGPFVDDPDPRTAARAVLAIASTELELTAPQPAEASVAGQILRAEDEERNAAHAQDGQGDTADRDRVVPTAVGGRMGSGIDSSDLRDRLVQMIVDGIDDVAASEVLGRLAARSAAAATQIVDVLQERIGELQRAAPTDPQARGRLVQALGELPGQQTVELLQTLTGDDDPAVAMTARYLLNRTGLGSTTGTCP